jgi:hypothetical protein
MGIRWSTRRARRATGSDAADATRRARSATTPRSDGDVTIDLREHAWTERLGPSTRMAALHEELRTRRAREEAERDLGRLRQRHWSGERVVEEGRLGIDFWEHHEADPYAVLSILPGASLEEAAAARRRIAQECHPDRLADDRDPDEALRRMVAANAAYDRLRRALRTV